MSAIPEKVRALLEKHKMLNVDAAWELPQRKGTWILKHKTIERLIAAEKITFELPQTVFCDAENAVVLVHGSHNGKVEWSYGEASPKNNKNAYHVAMAEKRAKDRVALKLLDLHGDVYSDEEADDFKEPEIDLNGFANAITRNEYFELVKIAMVAAESVDDLESLAKYAKRINKTDPQIEDEMRRLYSYRLKLLKEMVNEAD